MSEERAPCSTCRATFAGLCRALDDARTEAAALRVERYRRVDGPPIAKRAPSPTSATVRELRLELDATRRRIAELETANAHLRHVADEERRRAAGAEDGLRRAYRMALDVTTVRHA